MDSYEITDSVKLIQPFIADLSTWYIRRSRSRFVDGNKEALNVLYAVLLSLSKLAAPIMPFLCEEMYLNLKMVEDKQSVHLCDYPVGEAINSGESSLLELMEDIREICLLGNAERKKLKIKIRQPLRELRIKNDELKIKLDKASCKNDLLNLIKEELNVKNVDLVGGKQVSVEFDAKLTPELKAEGEARELIRLIQAARKKTDCTFSDKVTVFTPDWPKEWESEIKRRAIVDKLIKHSAFKVEKC